VRPSYNCLHPFRSSLCNPWRPCCPSDQATSRQPGILRRRSYGVEELAARHSNRFVLTHIQEPTQDSLIHPVLLYNVIFEYCMLYGILVVTLWTCYGALQIVVLLLLLLLLLLNITKHIPSLVHDLTRRPSALTANRCYSIGHLRLLLPCKLVGCGREKVTAT